MQYFFKVKFSPNFSSEAGPSEGSLLFCYYIHKRALIVKKKYFGANFQNS